MSLLVLNAGSSSLKLALFEVEPLQVLAHGSVQRVGSGDAIVQLVSGDRAFNQEHINCPDHAAALRQALDGFGSLSPDWIDQVEAVGHRIVHGGSWYTKPTLLTSEVESHLSAITELAPLHNRRAVEVIHGALSLLPDIPEVACFDTMFHATLPPVAARYALPRDLCERLGIRRYGFHGLSCTWSMHRLAELGLASTRRVIICHLGAGASVTAVLDGESCDTTMGLTPLEGLIMATRSGSIDPSIVLLLQRHAGLSVNAVEHLLEQESGMLGISAQTGDVQQLEQLAGSGNAFAEDALESFAYQVRKAVGAFFAVLGGVDVLVLTGGIAEHSAGMRARILRSLEGLGLELDEKSNCQIAGGNEGRVSTETAKASIWVIPAQEERVIARQVDELLGAQR